MSFANGGRIVTDGLVLSLDASDRNSYVSGSTTWNDLSGNNNNGTLQNSPTYSTASNGGITFLSAGSYTSTNLTVPSPSTRATTYEIAFIPATGSVGNNGLMGFSGYLSDGFSLNIYANSILLVQAYSGSSASIFQSAGPISFSTVNISTVVFENRKNTYYLNGKLYLTSTYSFDILPSSVPITIGGYSQGGWPQSQCTVFNAKVYNRALTASEVLQNYNASKSRFNLT
jgi:hypothetical protein